MFDIAQQATARKQAQLQQAVAQEGFRITLARDLFLKTFQCGNDHDFCAKEAVSAADTFMAELTKEKA